MSRRYAELTDGCRSCGSEGGQKLRRAETHFLGDDGLVRFDGYYALTQVGKTAGSGSRRHPLGDDLQPGRRHSGLFELIVQTQLSGGLRQ